MTFGSPSFEPVRLPSQGRSRAAVAAAVFATIGLIPVSLIFVIVAFQRVRRSTDRGMGFLLYALLMNLVALALITWGLDRIAPDASGSENTPAALTLSVGQCYDQTAKKQDHGARKIIEASAPRSCAGPHDGEVGAVFDASGESWPGKAAIETQADAECTKRMTGAPQHRPDGVALRVHFAYPDDVAWRNGVRHVVCSIEREDGAKLTTPYGSWRDLNDLKKGDCFDRPPGTVLYSVATTGCFTPHELEVVSTPRLPDGPWPGGDAVERKSVEGCRRAGMPKHDADGHPVELIYFPPNEQTWKLGDRLVVCLGRRVDHKKLTAFL
ncbi:septum formation family protein [Actinoallomurus sp. NPDC052308]|uniref:septum formation family protein n=1 Tax=Actinoallomurus sp. NPDC052308 TaxID=3155530 RepID=UPI0034270EBE